MGREDLLYKCLHVMFGRLENNNNNNKTDRVRSNLLLLVCVLFLSVSNDEHRTERELEAREMGVCAPNRMERAAANRNGREHPSSAL
eukprot:gene603-331_t